MIYIVCFVEFDTDDGVIKKEMYRERERGSICGVFFLFSFVGLFFHSVLSGESIVIVIVIVIAIVTVVLGEFR